MLSDRILNALTTQLNHEQYASHLYLAMSAYFLNDNLPGFAHWMRRQVEEETFHALKIFDYIEQRRGRIVLKAIEEPPVNWDSPLAVVEAAFKHEQKVSAGVHAIIDICREERDYATENFLQWFVGEQVEEEAAIDLVVQKLKKVLDSPSGMFILDNEMQQRQAELGDPAKE
jgi:ferritin